MRARVAEIYVAGFAGEPMRALEKAFALKGMGLAGDRYTSGRGSYSNSKRVIPRHLTLIEAEAIAAANLEHGTQFTGADTRRNIVTENVRLNELVELEFAIGVIAVRGVELCNPCERPSKLSDKPGFKEAFDNRGGLTVEVLADGEIRVGDLITFGGQEQPDVVPQAVQT